MSVEETVRGILGGAVRYEDGIDALTVAPAGDVDAVLAGHLRDAFERLFRAGWQPAELYRVVARQGDPRQGHLVAEAVAARIAGERLVDPRWRAQAAELPR